MNLAHFLERRRKLARRETKPRALCTTCLQSGTNCYCGQIRKIDVAIDFVILIHPHEARRRIATGRMAHLCLQRSHLIWGEDFSRDKTVNAILSDPARHCVVLYPAPDSQDISAASLKDRAQYIPSAKALTVFVMDGTWRTAKKMLRLSENLKTVPKISFTPTRASAFKIRKQPAANCLSTIEAIHQTIELLGKACGYDLKSRSHDELLRVFQTMVVRQLRYTPDVESDELNPAPKTAVSIRDTLD